MLSVKNLARHFDAERGQPAGGVFGIDLEVRAGEIFTLLGPSGCGKTTTLRCIAGLEHPDAGTIALGGRLLCDSAAGTMVPMYDRDIGMVFQSYAIWPHMSVFENAAYPLKVSRKPRYGRADIQTRVTRVLEMVGLGRYATRAATKLSGGQQQRLALARALVREPKLLLLDEPLSNLDAQLREQMRGELRRIQMKWGVTTIYVTHDQAEAMAMSDRVAVLNQGRVVQLGPPHEIYETPRSEFVANFIGRTNLLKGRLEQDVQAGGFAPVRAQIGTVLCRFTAAMAAGQDVSFVIRPENIEIRPLAESEAGAVNVMTGTVAGRVYLGDVAEYTVDVGGSFKLLVRGRPGLVPGDAAPVSVSLPPQHAVAIAPDS